MISITRELLEFLCNTYILCALLGTGGGRVGWGGVGWGGGLLPICGIVRMCVPNGPLFQRCQVYD